MLWQARYVWRGADDSYLNLHYFFSSVMPTLPATRLFLGLLRKPAGPGGDLSLHKQPVLQEHFGVTQWGQYMVGMGFLFSYDVADFVASLKIPPHLMWCEDLMVGMWLNPFQVSLSTRRLR